MKAIILSCTPAECEKIVNGDMSILVRKKVPKEVPFKAYIYETKESKMRYLNDRFNSFLKNKSHYTDMGKVIGEFICDKVYSIKNQGNSFVVANEEQGVTNEIARQSCLDYDDMVSYLGNKDGYGLHITDLKICEPKELSEFKTGCKGCKERDTYHCKFYCYGERPLTRPPTNYIYVEE